MKKIKFLADTYDKYTYEDYKKGEIKEFTNKRAEEILSAKQKNGKPFAEILEETIETATKQVKAETAVKKTRKVKSIEIDLNEGTVKENDI